MSNRPSNGDALPRQKPRLFLIAGAAVIAALAVGQSFVSPDEKTMYRHLGKGDYLLSTTNGQPFTANTLIDHPSAIFFGYTHCPDVCPTTMGDIAGWQQALGAEVRDLQVYFVTVDPERDTLPIIRDYLSWNPSVLGATGDGVETAKALKAFGIVAQKTGEAGGDYLIDHSSSVLLFDRAGDYAGTIPYQAPDDQALARLRQVISD